MDAALRAAAAENDALRAENERLRAALGGMHDACCAMFADAEQIERQGPEAAARWNEALGWAAEESQRRLRAASGATDAGENDAASGSGQGSSLAQGMPSQPESVLGPAQAATPAHPSDADLRLATMAFKAGQQAVDRDGEPYNWADSEPLIARVLARWQGEKR